MARPSGPSFDESKYARRPDVDDPARPELRRIGRGEQGVLIRGRRPALGRIISPTMTVQVADMRLLGPRLKVRYLTALVAVTAVGLGLDAFPAGRGGSVASTIHP